MINRSEVDSTPLQNHRKELTGSTEYFRQYVIDRIDSDERKRDELRDQLFSISDSIDGISSNVAAMSKALVENTEMTKRLAADLEANTFLTEQTSIIAHKTAADTADLVGISNAVKYTSNAVTNGTRKASKFSKVMTPILVLGGIVMGLWNGGIHWNDIMKVFK
jgi:hypothetical protein